LLYSILFNFIGYPHDTPSASASGFMATPHSQND
jgi:hypothetical protein